MSVCGPSEEDAGGDEGPVLRGEGKAVSKLVRVLTVLAYLVSVSLAAILLSVYYVCVWRSPDLPQDLDVAARRDPHAHYILHGGSNNTMSVAATKPDITTNGMTSSQAPETTTEYSQNTTSREDPSPTPTTLDNYNLTDFSTYNETNVT